MMSYQNLAAEQITTALMIATLVGVELTEKRPAAAVSVMEC